MIHWRSQKTNSAFNKALMRFRKEDPTFRVHVDDESSQTIISGMGELHLQIYVERMRREYDCECTTGQPKVAIRETCSKHAKFSYTHKKQSGGSGQYGKIEGYIEPISEELGAGGFEFVNELLGNAIPPEFLPAIEKGFKEAVMKGPLSGSPCIGVRVVLQDGLAHSVRHLLEVTSLRAPVIKRRMIHHDDITNRSIRTRSHSGSLRSAGLRRRCRRRARCCSSRSWRRRCRYAPRYFLGSHRCLDGSKYVHGVLVVSGV